MRQIMSVLILAALLVLAACGGGGDSAEPAAEPASSGSGAPAGKTVDPATAGSLQGSVTFAGEVSRGARIRMNADPGCAQQHSGPVYAADLVVGDGGVLANAFVWVKSGLDGYTFETPSTAVEIDQEGCIYTPRVVGVQTGQNLSVSNSDPTTHNIHPVPQQNREWNVSQAPNVDPVVRSFPRPEVMIPIKCNVHPWMKAYVGVVAHPYFAVTGEDGSFQIGNLPPGDYVVEAWHEKLGQVEMNVTVAASEAKEANFTFGG